MTDQPFSLRGQELKNFKGFLKLKGNLADSIEIPGEEISNIKLLNQLNPRLAIGSQKGK